MKKDELLRFYREQRQWLWLAAALIVLALAIALSVPQRNANPVDAGMYENSTVYYSANEKASQGSTPEQSVNSKTRKNSGYVLRLSDGGIAIYADGDATALYLLPLAAERLPLTDRVLLTEGLRADTLAEAYRLLEDYE